MTTNTNSAQERTASIDLAQLDRDITLGLVHYPSEDGHTLVRLDEVKAILARRSLTSGAPAKWLPTPANVNALPEGVRQYVDDLESRCDPAGDTAALTGLRDQMDGVQIMYRKAADALEQVRGCFEAAEVEGLSEALVETSDERLKDLVQRRLMHALYAAQGFDVHDAAAPSNANPSNSSSSCGAAGPSAEQRYRTRQIEHALKQIIQADDDQVLTDQIINIGRAALELPLGAAAKTEQTPKTPRRWQDRRDELVDGVRPCAEYLIEQELREWREWGARFGKSAGTAAKTEQVKGRDHG